jgi:hypothetical protein
MWERARTQGGVGGSWSMTYAVHSARLTQLFTRTNKITKSRFICVYLSFHLLHFSTQGNPSWAILRWPSFYLKMEVSITPCVLSDLPLRMNSPPSLHSGGPQFHSFFLVSFLFSSTIATKSAYKFLKCSTRPLWSYSNCGRKSAEHWLQVSFHLFSSVLFSFSSTHISESLNISYMVLGSFINPVNSIFLYLDSFPVVMLMNQWINENFD